MSAVSTILNAPSPFSIEDIQDKRKEDCIILRCTRRNGDAGKDIDPSLPPDAETFIDFQVYLPFICFEFDSFFHCLEEKSILVDEDRESGLRVALMKDDSSKVIHDLLLLCYPARLPEFDTVEHLSDVWCAAEKYCLDSPMLVEQIHTALVNSELLARVPERIYAVSVRHNHRNLCMKAAELSLKVDRPVQDRSFGNELLAINGMQHQALIECHRAVGNTVHQWLARMRRSPEDPVNVAWRHDSFPFIDHAELSVRGGHSTACLEGYDDQHGMEMVLEWLEVDPEIPPEYFNGPDEYRVTVRAPRWWIDFVEEVARQYESRPNPSSIKDAELLKNTVRRVMSQCDECRKDYMLSSRMSKWVDSFSKEIVHFRDREQLVQLADRVIAKPPGAKQ